MKGLKMKTQFTNSDNFVIQIDETGETMIAKCESTEAATKLAERLNKGS